MKLIPWIKGCTYILKIDCFADLLFFQKNNWPKIQRRYLTNLLLYVKDNSSYYQNKLPQNITTSNCVDLLKELPVINKHIINENSYIYYSREISNNWPFWLNTGGSTGSPFRFPSLVKGCLEGVCQRLLYKQMGSKGSLLDLIVAVDGSRVDDLLREKNVYWKTDSFSFPFGKYSLSTIYMSQSTLPYYISFLNKIKPSIMRGYPSGILELAHYIEDTGTSLSFKLKGLYLTSESFDSETEVYISTIFKCPVYGQYGHTESSIFAVKQPGEDEYVTSPLYGFTEILNDDNKQVKIGETGRIVVTGFSHYGTPFIRYDTGDLGCFGGYREDGSVIISSLKGRTVDYVVNRSNEKIYLIGFIFGGHLKAFNYIRKWQIDQNEKGIITLRIIKGNGYDEDTERELRELFESKGVLAQIVYVSDIAKTGRGKDRFLIQNVKSI